MIHVILSNQFSVSKNNIIKFVKQHIKPNFNYKLHFFQNHIRDFSFVDTKKDIILWQPNIANFNLEYVKQCYYSIVILDKPTIYVQKISQYNYINENMAINGGFYILYLNPSNNDITNDEWKLAVKEDMFLVDLEKLNTLILRDVSNIRDTPLKTKINVSEINEIKDNFFVKRTEQINLSDNEKNT